MQNETNRKLLPLKSDIVFQHIFADEANTDILSSFLSSALSLPRDEFTEVTVMDSRLERRFPGDKYGVLDVRIKTKAGIFVDVEVQLFRKPYMPERIMFYTSKNLVSQLKEGDHYGKIGKSVAILIANYNVFPGESKYRHTFKMCDPVSGTLFTDAIAVNVFELKKLPEARDCDKTEETLLDWLRLIKSEDLEEIEMLAAKTPEMGHTVTIIKHLSADERMRLAIEDREKAMRDRISLVEDSKLEGRIEGKAEGKIEGIAEGKREMAKKMLSLGVALDVISAASGLSAEEITALEGQ